MKLLALIHLRATAHQKIQRAARLTESPVEAIEHLKEAAIANQSVADVMNRSILEADLALTQAKESLRAWGLTSP